MSARERQVLHAVTGGGEPRLAMRSDTPVDTGRWLGRSRLWLCVTGRQIVLFAVARRQYLEIIELDQCQESYYNHLTGQLILKPAESLRFARIRLSPGDALLVLRIIETPEQEESDQPSNLPVTENSRA